MDYMEGLRREFGAKLKDRRGEIDALLRQHGKRRYGRAISGITGYVAHHIGPGVKPWGWDIVDAWRYAITRAPWYDSSGRIRYGWDTGNYAAGILPDGTLEVAALPGHLTYHVGAQNAKWFGAVVLHDCRKPYEPTMEELDALYRWFLVCDRTIGYNPWRGHQEIKPTQCPGLVQPHVVRMRGPQFGAASNPPKHYPF